jgi:hypothetical protein
LLRGRIVAMCCQDEESDHRKSGIALELSESEA